MMLPSISKSALLLGPCIAWTGPQAKRYDEALTTHEKQTDGTTFHESMEAYGTRGDLSLPDSPTVSSWIEHGRKYLKEELLPKCEWLHYEEGVGINWLTGDTLIGKWPGRSYPDMSGYQFGTADLVGLLKTGELYIGDWKTGSTDGAKEQLLSLAWGFMNHYTAYESYNEPRSVVTSCLFVNENGMWPHEEIPSYVELEAHADAMRFVWEDVVDAQDGILKGSGRSFDYVPGIHCTTLYCPHLGHCGAIAEIVSDLGLEDPSGSAGNPPIPVEALMKKLDDMDRGERQAVMAAANRRIKYETEANKKHIQGGGVVDTDTHVWEDRGNGYRWYKK